MSDFEIAFDAMDARVLKATAQITADGADLARAAAQVNIMSTFDHVTGRLAGSIDELGPYPTGPASFKTEVGPTVVYGRQKELGGWIFPKDHQYLAFHWSNAPGDVPRLLDGRVLARSVYQAPHPYLKPAVESVEPAYREVAAHKWADALRG